MPGYKARIYANGTITKYNLGEGSVTDIVASYNLSLEDQAQVLGEVYVRRPDLMPIEGGE